MIGYRAHAVQPPWPLARVRAVLSSEADTSSFAGTFLASSAHFRRFAWPARASRAVAFAVLSARSCV